MDITSILAAAHASALRLLCSRLGAHYSGVSAAAREARKQGFITPRMQKKLGHLDIAFAFHRHATSQHSESFIKELDKMLAGNGDGGTEAAEMNEERSNNLTLDIPTGRVAAGDRKVALVESGIIASLNTQIDELAVRIAADEAEVENEAYELNLKQSSMSFLAALYGKAADRARSRICSRRWGSLAVRELQRSAGYAKIMAGLMGIQRQMNGLQSSFDQLGVSTEQLGQTMLKHSLPSG